MICLPPSIRIKFNEKEITCHELHTPSQKNSSSSLDLVTFKKLAPLVSSMLLFQGYRIQDVSLQGLDYCILRLGVPDIAEDLTRLLSAIVIVEPSRTFWNPKDDGNDNLADSAAIQAWSCLSSP
jgi:hypothetical protein